MNEDEEILLAFLEESRENLDQLDRDLVDLESRGGDADLLARVFRVVHTLKGTCGFLGLSRLQALAHAGEDLLGAMRAGDVATTPEGISALLALIDVVRGVLDHLEATSQEPEDDHESLIARLRAVLPQADAASAPAAPARPAPEQTELAHGVESSVRVDVAVLDELMDLVGELVLATSRIGELAEGADQSPLAAPYRELRGVAGAIRDTVMTARMQPVGTVTSKFHRIARDLASALGKQVVVHLEGEEVGVDKAVNEALKDPLLHLVRNALDHGIESPAERLAAGKQAAGLLRIRAYHEGGRVHLDVSDDGRGIDTPGLVRRAVAAGVLVPERAAGLSPSEALELMFHAGLSTMDEITSTSGRGVGMDVVRTSLEQVGGSIDVASEPGQGVRFRLNVPLTLAIMPVLVVWAGGERYVVPQVNLLEVVQVESDQLHEQVDEVQGARLLRLRGWLLPLVDLAAHLGVLGLRDEPGLVVVVVQSDGRRLGLVVDEVGATFDAVIKPLPGLLRGIPAYAGTTILGDGAPALILDVPGIATTTGIGASEVVHESPGTAAAVTEGSLLLATAPDGGRLAIHAGLVRRLETFAPDQVERAGNLEVVQYGGDILPLLRVAEVLPERRTVQRATATPTAGTNVLAVVVCETPVGPVGLVVGSIDDFAAEPAVPRQPPSRVGVEACVVVGERMAELLDLAVLVAQAGIGEAS